MSIIFEAVAGKMGLSKLGLWFVIGILAVLAFILIPNANQIFEKLGFDTVASLKVDKAVLNTQLDQLEQVAEQTADAKQKVEAVAVNNDKLVSEVIKEKTNLSKKVDKLTAEYTKKKAIAKVVAKPVAKKAVVSDAHLKIKGKGIAETKIETSVSEEPDDAIKYIWTVYQTVNEEIQHAS